MSDPLLRAEEALMALASELSGEAATLEAAADILHGLRENEKHAEALKDAKERAARWNIALPF